MCDPDNFKVRIYIKHTTNWKHVTLQEFYNFVFRYAREETKKFIDVRCRCFRPNPSSTE